MTDAGRNEAVDALMAMEPHPDHAWMFENPRMFEQLVQQAWAYPSYVLPEKACPAVVFGIIHRFGVGEAWMVAAADFEKRARLVLGAQRALCAMWYKTLGLHRMHIMVESACARSRNWARHLGFSYETDLKRAGARGEDIAVYLWQKQEELP